jgi:hypothetical protein
MVDVRRAILLDQLSYELYLTDQLENARASRLEALENGHRDLAVLCLRGAEHDEVVHGVDAARVDVGVDGEVVDVLQ